MVEGFDFGTPAFDEFSEGLADNREGFKVGFVTRQADVGQEAFDEALTGPFGFFLLHPGQFTAEGKGFGLTEEAPGEGAAFFG